MNTVTQRAPTRAPDPRRASALVLFATGLTSLLLFCALVIDVGMWYTRRAQAQMNGDISVLAALGNVDLTQSYNLQRYSVLQSIPAILAANGYNVSEWSAVCTPDSTTTPKYVSRVTLLTTQTVPTFFWGVFTKFTPVMRVQSRAETTKALAAVPPCGFVALTTLSYGGGGGGVIDSYNSFEGGYNPANQVGGKFFDNSNAVGCANAMIDYNGNVEQYGSINGGGNVSIAGGAALIDGDIIAKGSISVATGVVQGNVKPFSKIPHFTLPTIPAVPATNDNASITLLKTNGNVDAFSGTVLKSAGVSEVRLPANGTYYFTEVDLTSLTKIVIVGLPSPPDAPTTIYADGEFTALGGIEFQAALAASGTGLGGVSAVNLKFYGTPNCTEVNLGGGAKIVGDFLAPQATLSQRGNSRLYGRLRANSLDIAGDANFTFDEALGTDGAMTDTEYIRVHLVE